MEIKGGHKTMNINDYIQHQRQRQADEDIRNILARDRQTEIQREISLFLEGFQ